MKEIFRPLARGRYATDRSISSSGIYWHGALALIWISIVI